MDKIYNLDDAKKYMLNTNIIICTTIRNIGENFLSTFCNIEILAQQFNNVHCVVFENDSSDNTRQMLIDWNNKINTKITKHIILMDNLIYSHPLRTHRLAYCRNNILKYIYNMDFEKFSLIKRDARALKKVVFGENDINDWNKIIILYNLYLIVNFYQLNFYLVDFLSTNKNTTFKDDFKHLYLLFFFLCSLKASYGYLIVNVNKVDNGLAVDMIESLDGLY